MERRVFLRQGIITALGTVVGLGSLKAKEQNEQTNVSELIKAGTEALSKRKYLRSPYLVSVLFYSENYFNKLKTKAEQNKLEPNETVLLSLYEEVKNSTSNPRLDYARYLQAGWEELTGEMAQERHEEMYRILDIDYNYGSHEQFAHSDALDIYAPISSPVKSPVSGIVVMADQLWDPADPLSTVSQFGGNSVIIYDPATHKQYRLCHFDQVTVTKGQLIKGGDQIGTVGLTGTNANKLGPKDAHIHIEVHQLSQNNTEMIPLKRNEIKRVLEQAQ